MELVKKTEDYAIFKKRNERYAVCDSKKTWLNGDAKVKVLLAEKLITAPVPKPKEEAPAEEVPAEEAAAEESGDEGTEEAPEKAAE